MIAQAKEAWKKKQEGSKDGGEYACRIISLSCPRPLYSDPICSVITDPEDPRFDLEKLIAKWESESK